MNDNDELSSNGNDDGNGDGNADVAVIADAGTQIIPCVFADQNVHKSISNTSSNGVASAVLLGGDNGIGNINGTNNINTAVAVAAIVVDDDDDDSDSDTNDDMPELEEYRHVNNRSRHVIGNRRMSISHQLNIQGTNNETADEENQSVSLEEPVVELPQ